MKIIKIIVGIFTVWMLLHVLSYHDINNVENIIDIKYACYVGEYKTQVYTEAYDIKRITRKLQYINFYPISSYRLQESPTHSILINQQDGMVKKIRIAGMFVMIVEEKDFHEKIKGFYVINPFALNWIFGDSGDV